MPEARSSVVPRAVRSPQPAQHTARARCQHKSPGVARDVHSCNEQGRVLVRDEDVYHGNLKWWEMAVKGPGAFSGHWFPRLSDGPAQLPAGAGGTFIAAPQILVCLERARLS